MCHSCRLPTRSDEDERTVIAVHTSITRDSLFPGSLFISFFPVHILFFSVLSSISLESERVGIGYRADSLFFVYLWFFLFVYFPFLVVFRHHFILPIPLSEFKPQSECIYHPLPLVLISFSALLSYQPISSTKQPTSQRRITHHHNSPFVIDTIT